MTLRHFFDWFREQGGDARPWLIFGKGPSFAKRHDYDLATFHTFGLNHVCREQPVTVTHAIDLEVIDACGETLFTNASVVVMPWQPHTRSSPILPLLPMGTKTLEEHVASHPLLQRLAAEGRLLWYNLSTGNRPREGSPVISARFFSAEAALNLLAEAGAKTIRSLGIDGGASYSSEFRDLNDTTLLANKRSSFDKQFQEFAKTILTTGVDYAPLDIQSPVRVFVATEEAQMLAVEVLRYSIRKHASMSTEVIPMHRAEIEIPMPADERNRPRTPFSFQRFLVPQLAGYQGRAIYLDSDMQVFDDIRRLWTMPFQGADLLAVGQPEKTGRKPQFSVMLLDCDRLRWDIRELVARMNRGELTYESLMYDMAVADYRMDIDPAWNSLEAYDAATTSLVHYTDMHRQPWVTTNNPLEYLWTRDLLEAVAAGHVPVDLVREHVRLGFIRPSLLYQVEHGIESCELLPRHALALDRDFVAPYRSISARGATGWRNPLTRARAAVRHYFHASGLQQLVQRVRDQIVK